MDASTAADRRSSFFQTVAEAAKTTLPDNLDYLFVPHGPDLPDPDGMGARIAEQLAVLDRCDTLWEALGDEPSRTLLLRLLTYRALGPQHVRLQLDTR